MSLHIVLRPIRCPRSAAIYPRCCHRRPAAPHPVGSLTLHTSTSRLATQSTPPSTLTSGSSPGTPGFDAEELRRRIAGTPLEAVIKGSPEVIKAFEKIGEVMRSKGIDTSTPPSKFTMLKLAMDSEFRACLTDVMGHLKAAGVDVSPEAMQKMFGEAMSKK